MKARKRYSKFKQGIYKPRHPDKCINRTCTYRSSWELKFMEWCDKSPKVKRWGSESFTIPYTHPIKGTRSRYYPDGIVWMDRGPNTKTEKYVIEIKPDAQTRAPKVSKRKKQKTVLYEQVQWAINQAKWETAVGWCKKRGMTFLILTEKHLGL